MKNNRATEPLMMVWLQQDTGVNKKKAWSPLTVFNTTEMVLVPSECFFIYVYSIRALKDFNGTVLCTSNSHWLPTSAGDVPVIQKEHSELESLNSVSSEVERDWQQPDA